MEQRPLIRTCRKCKETKDFELFSKDKTKKFGRKNLCKKCHNKKRSSVKTWEQREKLNIQYCLKYGKLPSTITCTKCKEVKPLELFRKSIQNKFGRRSTCKKCDSEEHRKYYIKKYKPKVRKPKEHEEPPVTKVCKKCNLEKQFNEFVLAKSCIHGRQNICISCNNLSRSEYRKQPEVKLIKNQKARIYYQENRERCLSKNLLCKRTLYSKNPEKYREQKRIYCIKNREKINERVRKLLKKQVEVLDKNYLKSLLRNKFNIPGCEVTDEQLELQRESILLHREYEQLKQQLQ